MAGNLIVIAAPSGAGKTSLVKALLESVPDLVVSISHTTREPRPGEVDGQSYHFIDKAGFESLVGRNGFLEHASVFDNYYGTARESVEAQLLQGVDVILEIDWQGARQVRKRMACYSIFILPPSKVELERRLRGRGTDSEEVISRRMRDAQNEMSHYHEFDYVVVNDDFDQARAELANIIQMQRFKVDIQQKHLAPLLDDLLAK